MRLTNGRQDLPGGLSIWRCSDGFMGTYSDRPAGRRDIRGFADGVVRSKGG